MSQDVKQKRKRLSGTLQPEVVAEKKEDQVLANANVPPEEFDWAEHEAGCPSLTRKANTKKG